MKKRILASLMAVCLVLTILPTTALAEEDSSDGRVSISTLGEAEDGTYDTSDTNKEHVAYTYYNDETKKCYSNKDTVGSPQEKTLYWVKTVTITGINFGELTDSSTDMEKLKSVILNGRRTDTPNQFQDSIEVTFVNCVFNQTTSHLQVYKIMPCNVTKYTFKNCTFNQQATAQYAITLNASEDSYDHRAISYEIIDSFINSKGRGINIAAGTENNSLGSHMPAIVISGNTFNLPAESDKNMAVQISGVWNSANLTAESEPLITVSGNDIQSAYAAVRVHDSMNNNTGDSAKYLVKFTDNVLGEGVLGAVIDGTPTDTMKAITACYDIQLSGPTAQVGEKQFAFLEDAIAEAENGSIIQILKDVTVATAINAQKTLTFQGVTKADGTKPKISGGSGIFSQAGGAQYTLENLNLEVTANNWYIYHSANKLTVNNCDFTVADGVTSTGNVIMGEGHVNQDTFAQYSLTFTNNTITANSRAAITGIGNNSVITDNVIDLISEEYGNTGSRTSILALVAKANGGPVTITGNTFKNANRVLAVDNSTLAASDLTYQNNQFIETRYALELSPVNNKDCGTYDINNNYYVFGDTVSAPKVENADSEGSHFEFADNEGTEYVIGEGEESLVENDVYYTAPSMRPEDLNTYVPPVYYPPVNPNPSYSITAPSVDNGTLNVSPASATKNTDVTITVTPDKDYELASLTVTDANGNRVPVKQVSDTKFTFTMPASKVTVNASFSKIVKELPFTDVSANDYFYDAVVWAVENGVTYGNTATTFGVGVTCNRADAVTFIWRAYGCPAPKSSENPFTDVSNNAYYADAVLWAVENGITVGTSATTFSPLESCRREHIVTFLYRAAGSPTVSHSNGFSDVADSAYYANAVTWAAENGITVGAGSATTFGPTQNCFREQIVTFLYRNLAE